MASINTYYRKLRQWKTEATVIRSGKTFYAKLTAYRDGQYYKYFITYDHLGGTNKYSHKGGFLSLYEAMAAAEQEYARLRKEYR